MSQSLGQSGRKQIESNLWQSFREGLEVVWADAAEYRCLPIVAAVIRFQIRVWILHSVERILIKFSSDFRIGPPTAISG